LQEIFRNFYEPEEKDMSIPKFPEIPDLSIESSINQVISSIAVEELALSHILNTEGEKLQYILGTLPDSKPPKPPTFEEILEANESVKDMLSTVSMNQMFLMGKLSAAMSAYSKIKDNADKDNGGGNDKNGNNNGNGGNASGLEVVNGRILDKNKTGDSSNWIEIATFDKYSLIVRQNYINIFSIHINEPEWQHSQFGTTNSYKDSIARTKINDWFAGVSQDPADNLSANATLRDFTVKNTALDAIGTGTVGTLGISDGFSKPVAEPSRTGSDIAFALSYGEAANFISKSYSWGGGQTAASPAPAQINFDKIVIPAENKLWLRSPGYTIDNTPTASELSFDGRVFETYVDGTNGEYALIYPALWVASEIFKV
jgi:hypothetical protein